MARNGTNGTSQNPFDAIAVKAGPSASKSVKAEAEVPAEVKAAVDLFIMKKAALKQTEAEMNQIGDTIISAVRDIQEQNARSGRYFKSFEVAGNTGKLTYTTSDKFSVPKEPEVHQKLRELLKNRFDQFFRVKRTISLKESIQDNTQLLQRITKALSNAGINIAEVFDVVDMLVAQDNLDRNQYELPPEDLKVFRTLVRQNKPSLY